jgi:hypothetical protein
MLRLKMPRRVRIVFLLNCSNHELSKRRYKYAREEAHGGPMFE